METLTKNIFTLRAGAHHAQEVKKEMSKDLKNQTLEVDLVPEEIFDYIFKLQRDVENDGPMDYHKYAKEMWRQLSGEEIDKDSEGLQQFEKSMILGLHNIDMSVLVEKSLVENLPQIVSKYQNVKGLGIWTNGDTTATGYQLSKVRSSGIIRDFSRALHTAFPSSPQSEKSQELRKKRSEIASRTDYIVSDNKFERLVEFAGQILEKKPREKLKIVIIEDSRNNFDRAQKCLNGAFGEGKVDIVPVWFMGSREGKNAKTIAAENSKTQEAFDQEKQKLNAIDSFSELLEDRFTELFQDAHVLVDFDGVIGDNIKMRVLQAKIIWGALVNGIYHHTQQDQETIIANILERLPKAA